jgi:hypothetical protein
MLIRRFNPLILSALITLATAPVRANDLLLEHYNAEKTHAATRYQDAMKACKARAPAVVGACRNAAQADRKRALQQASAERDMGLKCLNSCGLVTKVADDAQKADKHKKARAATHWQVAYQLYDGTAANTTFDHKPKLAAGDRIRVDDGKLLKR